jgi:hypothetical protein
VAAVAETALDGGDAGTVPAVAVVWLDQADQRQLP